MKLPVCVIVTTLLVSACGEDTSDRGQVRAVVDTYLDAAADQDAAKMCKVMPPGSYGGKPCEAAAERSFGRTGKLDRDMAYSLKGANVTSVKISGDHAIVTTD